MAGPLDALIPPPITDDIAGAPVGFAIPPPVLQPIDVGMVQGLPAEAMVPPPVPGQEPVAAMAPEIPPPLSPEVYEIPLARVPPPSLGMPAQQQPAPVAPAAATPPEPTQPAAQEPAPAPAPARTFTDPTIDFEQRRADAAVARAVADEAAMERAAMAEQRIRAEREERAMQIEQARADAFDEYQAQQEKYQDQAGKEPMLDGNTKIALVVSTLLKGLASGLSGGKLGQDAAQIIERTLRQRAQEMARQDQIAREKIQTSRQNLMDMGAMEGEFNRQTELAVAGQYNALAQEIRQNAAQYGTAEARANAETLAARMEQQAAAAQAKAAEERGQQLFENRTAIAKIAQDRAALDQRERESRRQTGLGYANIKSREREAARDRELAARKLEADGNSVQAKLVREQGVPLPGTGGKMMLAPDTTAARDLRSRVTAAKQIVDIADTITRKRADLGVEGWSDWLKSEEGKAMTADWRNLFMEQKDFWALGAIQGADEKLIEGLIGGDPATAWRTTAPILAATRRRIVQRTNSMLQDNDTSDTLGGWRWDPAEPAAPAETEASKLGRELTSREGRNTVLGDRQAVDVIAKEYQRRGITDPAQARAMAERDAARETPWVRNIEDRTEEALEAPPARRTQILDAMRTAASQESGERKAKLQEAIKAIESGDASSGKRRSVF